MVQEGIRVPAEDLRRFCQAVFEALDVPPEDAAITADVLVTADLRGIDSHGVVRLGRYVEGLRRGVMLSRPKVVVVRETPATGLLDGGGGLGQPIGVRAMKLAMSKAKEVGAGFVAVRNSNHYGIAAYYAMMALKEDLIGLSLTNATPWVVPTFGTKAILGTNPLSLAAPARNEHPLVLDMATSVVPLGKLEMYDLLGKPIPKGWATDERGLATTDPGLVLQNLRQRTGGGILPLGGEGEEFGGHKGYGLAVMVDVLCGVLSGACFADSFLDESARGRSQPDNLGHFLGALRVDAFRPLEEFKADMDDLIRRLKDSPKAQGQSRIYVHGEKEWEMTERRDREGILLLERVLEGLRRIGRDVGVEGPR